jgi:hypothetical protein
VTEAARLAVLLFVGVGLGLVWSVLAPPRARTWKAQLRRSARAALSALVAALVLGLMFLTWLVAPA